MTQITTPQPFTRINCICGECGAAYNKFKQVDYDGAPIYRCNDDGSSVHPLDPDAADKYFCDHNCAYKYMSRIHYGNTKGTKQDIPQS